ncbi:hypothetical protein [Helicobacter himalayensis]|uniref:hypothetical protein n=1 Tax=Helicobacter himalayensis TaxID=1591088 RepID=UPI00082CBA99|nr:hypothetical protein [Helicobacter himalayensis]
MSSNFFSFLRFVSPLILFALFFGGFFLLFSSTWISTTYGEVTFLQILFHLQFPIDDVDPKFLLSFREHVIFPSIILSAILSFSPLALKALKLFLRKILKHTKIFHTLKSCTPFFFTFTLCFIVFLSFWIYRIYTLYAPTTLDKFLFELKLPEIALFASFVKRVFFPSVLLSVLIFSVPIYHYCKEAIPKFYTAIKHFLPRFYVALRNFINKSYAYFKRYSRAFILSVQYGGVIALVLVSLNLVNKKFGAFKALFQQDYSLFYENYYKPFALKINSQPKNLIVIFVESLESTFSLKSAVSGGGGICTFWRAFAKSFNPCSATYKL